MMNRRELLQALLLSGLAQSFGGMMALANPRAPLGNANRKKRFFVMIRAATGWDVTLGLDPKVRASGFEDTDMFIEYTPSEILKSGSLSFGPSAAPLLPYASDLAVINGVFMSDSNVSHPANLDYISTGDPEGRAADLPVEISHAGISGPFGVIFNQSLKRGNRDIMPTRADSLLNLRSTADLTAFIDYVSKLPNTGELHRSKLALMKNGAIQKELLKSFDLVKDDIASGPGANALSQTRSTAAVIAASFLSGAALHGLIDINVFLDTHAQHEKTHLQNQKQVWEAVAHTFKIFKGLPFENASLFDATTFMVVSEFSRTPALNSSAGKDHNPLTNSVLLAGHGIRGGTLLGASQLVLRKDSGNGEPRHCASAINFSTGQVAKTRQEAAADAFQFIFPEHVAATVASALDLDRSRFSSTPSSTPVLDLILKM
jgi:uncharacterized protein (DUF1501 family)